MLTSRAMSPFRTVEPATPAVLARTTAIQAAAGDRIRAVRRRRRWSVDRLARAAGISRSLVYLVERGEGTTIATYARIGTVLGMRVDLLLDDDRAPTRSERAVDPVHAAMVELLAARYAERGRWVGTDEPFQHFQFAGRADLAVIDPTGPDLLHHEVKTAIPNVGELAGAWNVKRQYLAGALAARYGYAAGFRTVTHVLTLAWTGECLRVLRLRAATICSLAPDDTIAFEAWWARTPPVRTGTIATAILLDPIARPRATPWIGLDGAPTCRPRHAAYAGLLDALRRVHRA